MLGGIASGKSAFAEGLLNGFADRRYFATAQAFDDEMKVKIAKHQSDRGTDWITVEAPRHLPNAISEHAAYPALADCLTLWLSNLLLEEAELEPEFEALKAAITGHQSTLVIVSNEVGTSPVSMNALGRKYQNAQGRLNQEIAAIADKVYLVTAGLPMVLK